MPISKKYLAFIYFSLFLSGTVLIFFDRNFLSLLEIILNKQLDYSFWKHGLSRTGIELLAAGISVFIAGKFMEKYPRPVFLYLSIGWILLFLIYVFKGSINIPLFGDYPILVFLNSYHQTKDLSKVFIQFDEDREFLVRFLPALLYHLQLFDFRIIILCANIFLVGCAVILFKVSRPLMIRREQFLFLLIILIFHFEFYDAVVNAAGAIYHMGSAFFAILSLYFLKEKSNRAFFFAMIFSLLASLSIGNGFLLLLIGVVFLLLQKRNVHLSLWIFFSIIFSLFYFYTYSTSQQNVSVKFSDLFSFERLINCVLFGLTFIGSATQFLYQKTLPMFTGATICVYFIYLTIKKYYLKNPTVYLFLCFLIFTSFMPQLLRSFFSTADALSMRYGVYSIMAIACCLIAWFENDQTKNVYRKFAFVFTIVFFYHLSTNIFFYPEVVVRKERMVAMIHNVRTGKPYVKPPFVPDNALLLIKDAVHNGYYFPDY